MLLIVAEFSAPLTRKGYELRNQKIEITPMQAPRTSHEDEFMAERWYCTVNHRSRSAVISDAPLYSTSAWAITTVVLRSKVASANDVPVEVVNLMRLHARRPRGDPKESGNRRTRFRSPHQNGRGRTRRAALDHVACRSIRQACCAPACPCSTTNDATVLIPPSSA